MCMLYVFSPTLSSMLDTGKVDLKLGQRSHASSRFIQSKCSGCQSQKGIGAPMPTMHCE